MRRILLPLIAIVLLLGAARAAYAATEGYLVGKDGTRYPGKIVLEGDEEYFVTCSLGTKFSLTKYPMRVIDAPDGACPDRIGANSAHSDVLADSPEGQRLAAEAEKARKAERRRFRKIIEEFGYDVPESDVD